MKLGKPLATGFAEEIDDETVTAEAAVIPDEARTPFAPLPIRLESPEPVEASSGR
ncbi:hypothetical protein [Streptomyces sp. NBC_01262]|uniref:hypothetical protein n=1 Tax=Streptomyces sp. NBC_01262 TaxID=2903803 RepID=UPI002E37C0DF|nr:hypothetical protein [Streptomyces sp. NBC_01262]